MPEHDSASQTAPPPRVLGPIDATCVVVGAIIGVGIFFTPSDVARFCPSTGQALLAWTIAGVIALCGSLVFAELGGMYHGSAAQYSVLRDSYGALVGFLFVFCNATVIIAGSMGIIAIVCAQNLLAVFTQQPVAPATVMSLSCVLIALLAAANIIGVRWGARIQNLTVYAKVFTLLAITALAMYVSGASTAAPPIAAPARAYGFLQGLTAALVPTLFAYGGWQQVLWVAGEVKNPAKNVPRAIIGGVALVVVVYLLVNWAYLHLLGPAGVANSETLAADAVAVAAPNLGRRVIAAAVAISAFGVLNAQLLTGPRLIFGLARDGRFFAAFGELNSRFRTPVLAIGLLAIIAITLVVAAGDNGIDALLTGVAFVDGIFFVMTGAALLVLRIKKPHAQRSLRVPFTAIVLPLFILGELGVVIGANLNLDVRYAPLIGLGWIAVAAAIYFLFFAKPQSRDDAM